MVRWLSPISRPCCPQWSVPAYSACTHRQRRHALAQIRALPGHRRPPQRLRPPRTLPLHGMRPHILSRHTCAAGSASRGFQRHRGQLCRGRTMPVVQINTGYICFIDRNQAPRCFLRPNRLFHFRRITPNTASPNMEEFILDVPSTRFTKIMGTSTMRKPSSRAVNFISIWKA